jgi:hypothetical protein
VPPFGEADELDGVPQFAVVGARCAAVDYRGLAHVPRSWLRRNLLHSSAAGSSPSLGSATIRIGVASPHWSLGRGAVAGLRSLAWRLRPGLRAGPPGLRLRARLEPFHGTRTGASTTRNPTLLNELPGVMLKRYADRQ